MKTNSDAAAKLANLLAHPPIGLPLEMIQVLSSLAGMIKDIDTENVRLRQEVQMLRAVLEQERDKVC